MQISFATGFAGLALAALIAATAPAAAAPLDDFHKAFDTTLSRHGIVGGAFGFEHGRRPTRRPPITGLRSPRP